MVAMPMVESWGLIWSWGLVFEVVVCLKSKLILNEVVIIYFKFTFS
jgi:hypothetical protein